MFSLDTFQALFLPNLALAHHLRPVDIACALGAVYAFFKIAQVARRRLNTTVLLGPPNPSFLWGLGSTVSKSQDPGSVYEKWAEEYGGVYEVPLVLGRKKIVLCDPKAVAHFYGGGEFTYSALHSSKIATENLFGKGIFTAEGETHRRQRKTMAPAFTNASIRSLTSIFYDSAYKAKGVWDSAIESNGGRSTVIEVQSCMNHVSLDTVGIAGFSHDFGSLDDKAAEVAEVFDAFGDVRRKVDMTIFVLAQVFSFLVKFPTPLSKIISRLNDTMEEISNELFTQLREKKEVGALEEREEKSVLGLLLKAENQISQRRLTRDEVTAQVKALLLAGYETTSRFRTLKWALIELSRNPDVQAKLREELLAFGIDPTYDQLSNGLPYLDAVVHETLRMHAPLTESLRVATKDDIIPLSKPVCTSSGKLVDHISVAKGAHIYVSITCINRSTALWGSDAKEFKPERWIAQDGIPGGAKEVQGHRHLLTFLDGPRTCIGKGFAIAEFKIVLSVLVKNFVFELCDGPETVIEIVPGFLFRPRVVGEQGTAVPLHVRRFE